MNWLPKSLRDLFFGPAIEKLPVPAFEMEKKSELSSIEQEQHATIVALLARSNEADTISVKNARDVTISWTGAHGEKVSLAMYDLQAFVSIHGEAQFAVLMSELPEEVRQKQGELWESQQKGVCAKALAILGPPPSNSETLISAKCKTCGTEGALENKLREDGLCETCYAEIALT